MIDQAIDGTRLYGRVAVTRSGELSNPDVVAEFADLMVRLEGIRWSLAVGRYGPDLWLSIRTNLERANAGRMIRRIVGGLGKAGGHGMMAGGKIPDGAATAARAGGGRRDPLRARPRPLGRASGVPLVEVNGSAGVVRAARSHPVASSGRLPEAAATIARRPGNRGDRHGRDPSPYETLFLVARTAAMTAAPAARPEAILCASC